MTSAGSPARCARVYVVHSTPAWASADATSRTYTFIPPLSPAPGCSSGDVCSEIIATLFTTSGTLPSRSTFHPATPTDQ